MEREDARVDIAALFEKHRQGDSDVLPALVSAVREELRRRAAQVGDARGQHPAHRVEAAAALYRQAAIASGLPDQDDPSFLAVCARAMRQIVVQYMRGDGVRDGLTGTEFIGELDSALDVVDAMNERLARVVECRYFAALDEEETAGALSVDAAAVRRDWTRARAWVLKHLAGGNDVGEHDAAISNAAWVDAVFDDALALQPGELERFLERCSAAPGELRSRVEALVRFSTATVPRFEPGDLSLEFLLSVLRAAEEEPPMPLARLEAPGPIGSDDHAPAVPGSPGWRIIRELHQGRLGRLYLAERPDRPSWPMGALRFVPGEPNLATFRRRPDWRIVSSLAHAGIARLLDAGRAEDGRVFVVSELVEGRPIDRYCDEELLTIEQRLALFVEVCRAVQYGHRKLAVHGAINPGNVLVTAEGKVKLLDFGVAGLVAADDPPQFPSPEQRRGEPLGVASDVYQLGLLLHVLLTGALPYVVDVSQPGTIEEVLASTPLRPSVAVARVAEESASLRNIRPRGLVRKLRGDLDAIAMYALRRQPERRYPSVSLLRSDIQRYLQRQPVWAQGDRLSYRFRKFVVRRSAPIAVGLVLMMVGAAALPGALPAWRSGSAEALRVAEMEALLDGMFAPQVRADGLDLPSLLHAEQAARIARTELTTHPASQSRLFTKVGQVYAALGFYERSISILEEALTLRRSLFGDNSLEVAETLEALAYGRHQLGRYAEAESDLRHVIALRDVRKGAAHAETLSATIALGEVLYSRGQFVEAEELIRGASDVLRPEVVEAAAGAPVNELLPRALTSLANVVRDRGALGEAAVLYREAIAVLENAGAGIPPLAAAQVGLSRVLLGRAELDAAETQLERALAALRRAYPDEHPLLGMALGEYGTLRLEQGQLDAAHELLSEALRIQEHWLGRTHPLVPRTRAQLAELARRRGRAPEAVSLATAALKQFEQRGLADHPWTVDVRATLADALIALDRDEDALRVLSPALTSAPRVFVSYDARLTRLQAALARASRKMEEGKW